MGNEVHNILLNLAFVFSERNVTLRPILGPIVIIESFLFRLKEQAHRGCSFLVAEEDRIDVVALNVNSLVESSPKCLKVLRLWTRLSFFELFEIFI